MLQSVAECCSVLQCDAVCCSVLQCVAVCCSVLQCGAVCCSVVQCGAVWCSVVQGATLYAPRPTRRPRTIHLPVARRFVHVIVMHVHADVSVRYSYICTHVVAVCCSVLQCVAVSYSVVFMYMHTYLRV